MRSSGGSSEKLYILSITSKAVEQAAGSLQLCAGQECGIEGAIHAMHQVYQKDDVHGVLLADASNAFIIASTDQHA